MNGDTQSLPVKPSGFQLYTNCLTRQMATYIRERNMKHVMHLFGFIQTVKKQNADFNQPTLSRQIVV